MVASSGATFPSTIPCIYNQVSDKIITVILRPGAVLCNVHVNDPSCAQTAVYQTTTLRDWYDRATNGYSVTTPDLGVYFHKNSTRWMARNQTLHMKIDQLSRESNSGTQCTLTWWRCPTIADMQKVTSAQKTRTRLWSMGWCKTWCSNNGNCHHQDSVQLFIIIMS